MVFHDEVSDVLLLRLDDEIPPGGCPALLRTLHALGGAGAGCAG